ncbi:MAG TPA: GntR family transcriptional regulator [Anaerolineae bacterium]|nr:GntR family transcriptional regulator [Anaerolineae bacterium]HPL28711.1 GntR family transcriptional regulator [Anaerolineae bacterium]
MAIERHVPVAEQVAILLHGRIADGTYAPGDRLPSEAELADELAVSRGTVRSALAVLATAGLIVRRQGDGTYVTGVMSAERSLMHVMWEFTRAIELSGHVPSIRVVSLQQRPATEKEAAALNIGLGEQVLSVLRVIHADERPAFLSTNVHPANLFTQAIDQLDGTIEMRRFLQRYCNREIVCGDMDVSAAMPSAEVRDALSLGANVPVLLVESVFYDADGRPLVLSTSYYGGDKLSFHDVRRSYPWAKTR